MTQQHDVTRHICSTLASLNAGPSRIELAAAPLLEHWRPFRTLHGGTVLAGYVSGYPVLRNGPMRTSGLLALDPDTSWARTVSRWYRLGSQPNANTPIMPDNLAMALLIDGLHPLIILEVQKLTAEIHTRLRLACEDAVRSS